MLVSIFYLTWIAFLLDTVHAVDICNLMTLTVTPMEKKLFTILNRSGGNIVAFTIKESHSDIPYPPRLQIHRSWMFGHSKPIFYTNSKSVFTIKHTKNVFQRVWSLVAQNPKSTSSQTHVEAVWEVPPLGNFKFPGRIKIRHVDGTQKDPDDDWKTHQCLNWEETQTGTTGTR